MSNRTIKIGANCQRHIEKHEGATEANYVIFSKLTAQKVAISRMDSELTERLNIYTVAHLFNMETEVPEYFMEENECYVFLVENSRNPYELAKFWKQAKSDAENWVCKESVINELLPSFPKKDFERWGDKNWIKDVSKAWFFETGINLDVKVEEINASSSIEISIDDCIEFVKKYKPNAYKNPKVIEKENIEKRFKEVAGFNIKDYYAEHLIRSNEFFKLEVEIVPF